MRLSIDGCDHKVDLSALGVAVVGSVFFSLAGRSHTPSSLAHAFSGAMLCVAASLAVAALLITRSGSKQQAEVTAADVGPSS
ncbi:hypothetical protein [Herbaspirillum huttiense]|uniref:hypothetical protein n=1 Tax=Herbaspirillum huttiense TaxID=863372 RepID=UPI0039B001D6